MAEGQLEEGSLLNERYRIIRVIGQGGMGTVYQAEHERLKSIVAVKEIRGTPATGTAQQTTMEQYEQEARFLVGLSHPNLPKVTDAFVDSDRFYLVMDFVDGVTLENRLRMRGGAPMDPESVVNWAIEIADVLSYLHSQDPPIIFRDLKPSNVMVQPDGHIKLIDFGIARRFQPGAAKDTALLGSVGYSPPEQFGRHQTDTRSDIYALGATMHHLLTAQDPTSSPFKFAPVERIALGIPPSLSRLIAHCLAMDPDARPHNIIAVSLELRTAYDDLHHTGQMARGRTSEPSATTSTSDPKRAKKPRSTDAGSEIVWTNDTLNGRPVAPIDRRLQTAISVLGVVLVCGLIFVAYSTYKRSRAGDRTISSRSILPSMNETPTSIGLPGAINSNQPGSPQSNGGSQLPGSVPPDPGGTGGDGTAPPTGTNTAELSVEVVGASPDLKSVRLHVTGEINGKKDTGGMVAAYFYNADKTPLLARDPKSTYATPTGQLFAEFTFQIDADSKPIDGIIDVPVTQFTSTNNLLFRCIVYADNQSAGQTDLLPLSQDSND